MLCFSFVFTLFALFQFCLVPSQLPCLVILQFLNSCTCSVSRLITFSEYISPEFPQFICLILFVPSGCYSNSPAFPLIIKSFDYSLVLLFLVTTPTHDTELDQTIFLKVCFTFQKNTFLNYNKHIIFFNKSQS